MKKSIIFCVDDEIMVLNSLKTELKTYFGDNFIIETAESAKEALAAIKDLIESNYSIPLIISDYSMPKMNGDEFLSIIHKEYPEILKVLLTGQATVEGVTNAINNANLYRYIAKPWESNDLILTVNQAIKSYEDQNLLVVQNARLLEFSKSLEEKVEMRTSELLELNALLIEKNKEIEIQNEELLNYRNHLEELVDQRTAELIKARDKAEESDKLKSSFMANISHEIRTPMNGIIGFISLLESPGIDEIEKDSFFTYIKNCSQQLLSIITDIVEFSKLETSQVKVKLASTNLNTVFLKVYSNFDHNVFKNSKIKFISSCDAGNVTIITDEAKLEQILTNLINNAVKFTTHGTIEMGCSLKNNSQILFYVKDTGIGIPKEFHHLIFERFRQVETELSRNNGGTGLGLSISKAYVNLLGGEIWVESEPNKGSTFYFTLPWSDSQVNNSATPIKSNSVKFDFGGINILLAEDDEMNFVFLKYALTRMNINVIHAKNGLEAIDICRSNNEIDLVLMDVKMPELNGFDATQEILKFRNDLPVIIQTAGVFQNDIEKAFEVGAVDFVPKPINIDELEKKLRLHLKIHSCNKVINN